MTPSGPALLELPLSLIAWATISVVNRCVEFSSGHSKEFPLDNPSGRVIEMNCLVKAAVVCRLLVRVLDEKVMG